MQHPTHSLRWLVLFVALLVGMVGCVVKVPTYRVGMPPEAQQTPPTPPVEIVGGPRLPHPLHAENDLECTDCHELDEETGEPTMPDYEYCMDCHEDMDEEEPDDKKVGKVFFDADQKPRWRRALREYDADIIFQHKAHGAVGECTICHGDMAAENGRVARLMYTMAECMACHTEKGATQANTCEACHVRLRTTVAPSSHAPGWLQRHGQVALTQRKFETQNDCSMCHNEPDDCNNCHMTRRPDSHFYDWERRHGAAVRAAGGGLPANCALCHQDINYCDRCHKEKAPRSHKHLWTQRHGQIVRAAGGALPASCTLCHKSRSFCDRCHQDEEPRNHTHLFRTRTHGMIAAIDRESCATCHTTAFCERCHQDTPPRSHRAGFAMGRSTHCVQCHFPISQAQGCRVCHKRTPRHTTAPARPPMHPANPNCRICHNAAGAPPVRPLRHIDNGMACTFCHR